jgi:TM2 domain-containing membrane protein YozV/ribosomal protein S27AE
MAEERKITENEKFCTSCGQVILKQAEMCPKCGVRQTVGMPKTSTKSRTTAGILGILLGGLGVHKFYLGKTGLGILYLVFCWTFIPAIIGLIEGIIYLTMGDAAFAEKYGA